MSEKPNDTVEEQKSNKLSRFIVSAVLLSIVVIALFLYFAPPIKIELPVYISYLATTLLGTIGIVVTGYYTYLVYKTLQAQKETLESQNLDSQRRQFYERYRLYYEIISENKKIANEYLWKHGIILFDEWVTQFSKYVNLSESTLTEEEKGNIKKWMRVVFFITINPTHLWLSDTPSPERDKMLTDLKNHIKQDKTSAINSLPNHIPTIVNWIHSVIEIDSRIIDDSTKHKLIKEIMYYLTDQEKLFLVVSLLTESKEDLLINERDIKKFKLFTFLSLESIAFMVPYKSFNKFIKESIGITTPNP